MRDVFVRSTVLLLIITMIAGCIGEDKMVDEGPSSDPVRSSLTLYPMNGTGRFDRDNETPGCLHHSDDIVMSMHGTCFTFHDEARLWDFQSEEMPSENSVILNATLQLEYRNNFITPESANSIIDVFSWSFIGASRSVEWIPRLSETDVVDNVTLFSNESMTIEDLSTFSLHIRIRAGLMGGQRILFDRIVIMVDYNTNPIVLR
jgi:hypothetical protein